MLSRICLIALGLLVPVTAATQNQCDSGQCEGDSSVLLQNRLQVSDLANDTMREHAAGSFEGVQTKTSGQVIVEEVEGAPAHTPQSDAATVDWAHGAASWQQATRAHGEEGLWTQPNECDARVLHGSAPLSVLFGVSTFWNEIKQRRAALAALQSPPAAGKPLEVHVVGAAFPFEGRSDWSLLASRRPKDVPGVRVVLVLGTPWHMDNVPVMKAKEFDEKRSFLMQFGVELSKPETGQIRKDGGIECSKKGSIAGNDKIFRKADLCRNHGNGLEVVCIEKYYQEVSAQLPKPDVVAMFSPGFPQIARRSWDIVLRNLLAENVPFMVVDILRSTGVAQAFTRGKSKSVAKPGSRWSVRPSSMEDGMTSRAMRAYGARKLGAHRNPFPIFISQGKNEMIVKCAVLQVFRGRLAGATPFQLPSPKAIQRRKLMVEAMDLNNGENDESNAKEIKSSLLIPTSTAYDEAMWHTYRASIKQWVGEHLMHKKAIDKKWLAKVKEMGLTGKPRRKPWSFKEWIFLLEKLKLADKLF